MTKEELLQRAIELSKKSLTDEAGGPFGALIAKDGEIISEGWNRVIENNDPTAHAEVNAIRAACKKLGTYDLDDYELYTSCEPCPMCFASALWAKISKVYYANTKADADEIGFSDSIFYDQLKNAVEKPESQSPIMEMVHIHSDEAKSVFIEWSKKMDKVIY